MINHGNIYAHRRFPSSRAGKTRGLSISSASSMISLVPAGKYIPK